MTNTTGSNKKIQQKSNTSGLGSCNKFIIDFNLTQQESLNTIVLPMYWRLQTQNLYNKADFD